MLKALEILKELESYPLGFCHFKKEILKEAITELEALQNKSCDNCLYFSNSGYGFGLCNKGVSSDFKIGTFYCNKWEVKNECS